MTFVEKRIIAFGYSTKEAVKRLCQGIYGKDRELRRRLQVTEAPCAQRQSVCFFTTILDAHPGSARSGRITHKDPRSSAGAVAISGAVALALRDDIVNPGIFCFNPCRMDGDNLARFFLGTKEVFGLVIPASRRSCDGYFRGGV